MGPDEIDRKNEALDALLGEHPEVRPSAGFVGRVVSAADASTTPWWKTPRGIAASVAAVLIVIALFTTPRGDSIAAPTDSEPDEILELVRHVPPAPLIEDAEDLDRTWRQIQWIEENFLPTTE